MVYRFLFMVLTIRILNESQSSIVLDTVNKIMSAVMPSCVISGRGATRNKKLKTINQKLYSR